MKALLIIGLAILSCGCAFYPKKLDVRAEGQPCLIPAKGNNFSLCKDYNFSIGEKKFAVPINFVTDLASIPRLLWLYDAPHEFTTIAPAVVHDYLYRCKVVGNRKLADDVFYTLLLNNGASQAEALKFYLGVRTFGGKFYDPIQCEDIDYE